MESAVDEPIPVLGDRSSGRDNTYSDSVFSARTSQKPEYEITNLGHGRTATLTEMNETIEHVVGKQSVIDRQPEQQGDVPLTWTSV